VTSSRGHWRNSTIVPTGTADGGVAAIRVLPASLPIRTLAFVLGWKAHRGFLSWAVFALLNGILIYRGRR